MANRLFRRKSNDVLFMHGDIAAEARLLVTGDQDVLVLAQSLDNSHQLLVCKPAEALGKL